MSGALGAPVIMYQHNGRGKRDSRPYQPPIAWLYVQILQHIDVADAHCQRGNQDDEERTVHDLCVYAREFSAPANPASRSPKSRLFPKR